MSAITTILISTKEVHTLPAWLSNIIVKRRKIELPPDNLFPKKNKSKLTIHKAKAVSQILVDSEKVK